MLDGTKSIPPSSNPRRRTALQLRPSSGDTVTQLPPGVASPFAPPDPLQIHKIRPSWSLTIVGSLNPRMESAGSIRMICVVSHVISEASSASVPTMNPTSPNV